MTISAASTITSGAKTFPGPVTLSGANTKTLSGDWTVTGLVTTSTNAQVLNATTAEKIICNGGWTSSNTVSGTLLFQLGGGTLTLTGVTQNSITFAGNVTLSSTSAYQGGTITYSSGTITTTGNTLTISGSTTFNTAGISWNNITLSANQTLTINSLLTVLGTLSIGTLTAPIFAGTSGFTAATFSSTVTGASTVTLKNSVTYTITTAFNAFTSRTGAILLFTSDDGTLKANLTLNNGATCNVLASFTRIDASNGRAIWTFNGTVTTCFNIIALTDLSFVTGRPNVIQGNSNY